MSSQTKSVAIGFKRWARLWGASTAWSLGGWALLLALATVVWLQRR